METHLVVSAIGPNRIGLIDELARVLLDCGCRINDSRMAAFGAEFALVTMISGNWNAIAKFEHQVPRLAEKLELRLVVKRTELRANTDNLIPYGIEVVSIQNPSTVYDVTSFFSHRGINVEDLYTSSYAAPHTGAQMFALHMTVGIPTDTSIATIRGEFMDFCDELNLDAMLAPVK